MSATELLDPAPPRFVVGIDLGTTNSAVCYVDTERDSTCVNVFSIPQWVAAGSRESRDTLPSFHFQLPDGVNRDALLPWESQPSPYVVGAMARDDGQQHPARLIVSAKSWLSHHGVDRTADLLPWHATDDVTRLSPITASARYLAHLRAAWDHQFTDYPLSEQDVVLTLPASFDEVARELTVRAAAEAGLPKIVLIEEPQAAFYAWVDRHREDWSRQVTPGQKILVCDIGGGTSDFTLIRVREATGQAEDGTVQFHRIAVGEHLILGGDNLDLALARHVEQQLATTTQLNPRQWDVLVRHCRQAKEALLSPDAPEQLTVNLPGSGRRLVGGGIQATLTREAAQAVLVDGFFPHVELGDQPRQTPSGFQEFGLPYASDPAITRHLASFLTAHRHADVDPDDDSTTGASDPARPDLVLFNGGMFHADAVRQRLVDAIAGWFACGSDWKPEVLDNDRLDLAVARGAAYYGMVRRGEGVRIAAGLARSYYLGVAFSDPGTTDVEAEANTAQAICVVPGTAQPGEDVDFPDLTFELLISEPVEFPLYASSVRLTDRAGQSVVVDPDQMRALPPLRTALRTQRRNQRGTVPVQLQVGLSEIGTIELWCVQPDGERKWRLQFDVRAATETDRELSHDTGASQGVYDESLWEQCEGTLDAAFNADGDLAPNRVVKELSRILDMPRGEWPMSLLRRIWEALMERQHGRRLSAKHEARWLNLAGYALRPGFGMAVDDWRVTETWRHVQGKLHHGAAECRNEAWILWRRIAAGLPAGQQRALADPLLAAVRALYRRAIEGKSKGDVPFSIPEYAEVWRLLATLELLPTRDKTELGSMLLKFLPKRKFESVRPVCAWALGRLGSRVPFYGPLNTTIAASTASEWARALMDCDVDDPSQSFALMQLTRRTGDRYRDVNDDTTKQVAAWLNARAASESLVQLVTTGGSLDHEQQRAAFGESLPTGLRL